MPARRSRGDLINTAVMVASVKGAAITWRDLVEPCGPMYSDEQLIASYESHMRSQRAWKGGGSRPVAHLNKSQTGLRLRLQSILSGELYASRPAGGYFRKTSDGYVLTEAGERKASLLREEEEQRTEGLGA